MDFQNVRTYIAVSAALLVILIVIIIAPFSSKKNSSPLTPNSYPLTSPFPTIVQTGASPSNQVTNNQASPTIPPDFTGAIEETIPPSIIDLSNQKRNLQSKLPLKLSTFTIDFDYSADKFTVSLKDPKDQSSKEFESWRTANYPGLSSDQFALE